MCIRDSRHGRHLHQTQDERLPRAVILMDQPGNDEIFAVSYAVYNADSGDGCGYG